MTVKSFFVGSEGIKVTGLTPTWDGLKKRSNGSDVAEPSISEVGLGWYKYTATVPSDDAILGVIDCGATLSDTDNRYISVEHDYYDNKTLYDEVETKEVIMMPVYDGDADTITYMVFLQENGEVIQTGLTSVSISVYNDAHVLQYTISSSSETNGVFVVAKSNPTLTNSKSYYAIATLTKDDASTVVSAETYVSLE